MGRNADSMAGGAAALRPWNVPLGLSGDHRAAGPSEGARQRYIRDILRLHSRQSFGRLDAELRRTDACLYRSDHGRGVVTSVARSESIPERYLVGLAGFRLSEYLRAGFASEDLVFSRSLFCEPVREFHPADLHVITTDVASGRILGYVALAHTKDPEPRPLNAADRHPFPCEQAHDVRLQDVLREAGDLTTHAVREVKRFVHAHAVTDRSLRLRITLELLAALTRASRLEGCPTRLLIGDVEEHVALRHLVLLGLDVRLLLGTEPRLNRQNVMHPMYTAREKVLPFYAWAPAAEEVDRRGRLLERAAASDSPFRALRELMAQLTGSVRYTDAERRVGRTVPRADAAAGEVAA
ncbi:hypothetical protein [Streptomyces sp. NPDC046862]|uniref:hypothetical protein n=1 Tax=Streptomyces sp. NPDC046862 TaxID=3154603 RepID=UPI003456162F